MKCCTKCGEHKALDRFSPYKPARDGRQSWCKDCCSAHARDRYRSSAYRQEYIWGYRLQQYGLTVEDYEAIERSQNGVCAVCGSPPRGKFRKLHVDHCHLTGRVRGLLCNKCNSAIGYLGDSPEMLKRAINYLER